MTLCYEPKVWCIFFFLLSLDMKKERLFVIIIWVVCVDKDKLSCWDRVQIKHIYKLSLNISSWWEFFSQGIHKYLQGIENSILQYPISSPKKARNSTSWRGIFIINIKMFKAHIVISFMIPNNIKFESESLRISGPYSFASMFRKLILGCHKFFLI